MDALGNLGIDGFSVLLYLVNFGILLLLLQRFAYRPLLKMLETRREQIKTDVQKAQTLREGLEIERADEEQARATRLAQLDQQISSAKKMAREEAKKLLIDADEQRDAILAQASSQVEEAIAGTIQEAEEEILTRIKKVVLQVLEDGVPEEVAKESVKKSWEAVSRS